MAKYAAAVLFLFLAGFLSGFFIAKLQSQPGELFSLQAFDLPLFSSEGGWAIAEGYFTTRIDVSRQEFLSFTHNGGA